MTGTWDATAPKRDSLGEVLHKQAVGLVPSSTCSPKSEPRTRINPEIMELLAELAARFPKYNGDDEKPRLRLLAEDLSETMSPPELQAAIREGRKVWRYLPTLAEIVEAGAGYREERRDRQRRAELRATTAELQQPALPAPPVDWEAERAAMILELRAVIDVGTDKLLKRDRDVSIEPYSWRLAREAGQHVSPALRAFYVRMMADD